MGEAFSVSAMDAKRSAEESLANRESKIDFARASAELAAATAQLALIERMKKRGH